MVSGGQWEVHVVDPYDTHSEPIGKSEARTALATGILQLGGSKPTLERVKVIFRQEPPSSGGRHFGSRIVINKSGQLFLTLGDRGNRHLARAYKPKILGLYRQSILYSDLE